MVSVAQIWPTELLTFESTAGIRATHLLEQSAMVDWRSEALPNFLGYINPRLQGQTQGRGYGSWQITRLFCRQHSALFLFIYSHHYWDWVWFFQKPLRTLTWWQLTWRIKSSLRGKPQSGKGRDRALMTLSESLLTLTWVPVFLDFLFLLGYFRFYSCHRWR